MQENRSNEKTIISLRSPEKGKVISILDWKNKKKSNSEKEEELLYCVGCLNLITKGDQRIQVEGSHKHTFSNPVEITYNMECFQNANGAVIKGDSTEEFTWFKGFDWSMAFCGGCLNHIGWQYTGKNQVDFWGLILNALTTK